jgi:uncharacterized NAD-dependent epimerase/dehydratase family protein
MVHCSVLSAAAKIAIYMEGAVQAPAGKMGLGVLRYSPNQLACVIDSQFAGKSVKELTGIDREIPIVSNVNQAIALGANVFLLGIAPAGGQVPADWWPVIDQAVAGKMSLVNGLHDLMAPRYPELSNDPRSGRQFVWDIRIEPVGLANGNGAAARLSNRRLLMIGTDMNVGKMTAGLEIGKAATARGIRTGFVATGQIGITITGAGIPLDAIRVDFASGAVQAEVVRHTEEGAELVIVEGQGSLVHPGSTANLPLLRGSCPTHLIMCHRAGQESLVHISSIRIPDVRKLIDLYEDLAEACGTFPRPKTVGIALNCGHLTPNQADEACRILEESTGLPCVDVIRHGADRLVDELVR